MSVSTGVSNTSEFRYSHRNNEGDSCQVTSQGHGIGPPLPIQRPGNTVETGIELVSRIIAAYDIIQNISVTFVRVRQNLVRRCHACIEVGGVNLSNCCKMQNDTLIVLIYCILQVTVTNVNKK